MNSYTSPCNRVLDTVRKCSPKSSELRLKPL
nr:MAG TPA: hypothetical protein [Caudoviricetes sp.]